MRGKGKEDQKKLFEKEKNNLQKNFEEERKEQIDGFVKFYYDKYKPRYSYEIGVSCTLSLLEENKRILKNRIDQEI